MDPNFVVDSNSNNKSTNSKSKQITNQQPNDTHSNIDYINTQPILNNNNNNSSDIDEDTRCLMMLHQQIIPTPNQVI